MKHRPRRVGRAVRVPRGNGSLAWDSLRSSHPTGRTDGGFSLLEVILALAILTAMLTACLHLVYIGMSSARHARDQTRAQEIAESIMGLITSGVVHPDEVQGTRQDVRLVWEQTQVGQTLPPGSTGNLDLEESDWVYALESVPATDMDRLFQITLIVSERNPSSDPVEFKMVRFLIDPDYFAELKAAATTTEAPP